MMAKYFELIKTSETNKTDKKDKTVLSTIGTKHLIFNKELIADKTFKK